jgi:hypothetical protein
MPLRSPRRLLVALAAIVTTAGAGVLTAAPAMAGTSTGTVTGHVVTTSGSPAAGVPITLTTTVVQEYPEDQVDRSHVHVYTASTDAAGDWTVPDAQQGVYTMTVAPSSVWTVMDWGRSVTVVPGASSAPTITAVRLATIRGTIDATEDGSPIGGAAVSGWSSSSYGQPTSNDAKVLSVGDGGFAVHVAPGTFHMQVDATDRFSTTRTVTVAEGEDTDLGSVGLDPSGTVTTSIVSGSGHTVYFSYENVVVDGCRITAIYTSTCPRALLTNSLKATTLQLAPGAHTIRYEVRAPLTSTVRHTTRSVVVKQGETTTLAPFVVRADPTSLARVHPGTYRRGHAVTVRVDAAYYVDSTRPHLRTTFLVDGHAVTPTSTTWRAPKKNWPKVLVATLPAKWSTRKTLSIKAVAHGTTAYVGQTSKAVTLTRTK